MQVVTLEDADVAIVVSRDGDIDDASHDRPTMVLLERMDVDAARDAYASGAAAVLPVDAADEEIIAALRGIASGLVVMQQAFASELMASAAPTDLPAAIPLTPREREVLTLLARGLANKVIAARLGITEHTVKTHIAAVYEKLDARNRAEAVVAAARQGLITI